MKLSLYVRIFFYFVFHVNREGTVMHTHMHAHIHYLSFFVFFSFFVSLILLLSILDPKHHQHHVKRGSFFLEDKIHEPVENQKEALFQILSLKQQYST